MSKTKTKVADRQKSHKPRRSGGGGGGSGGGAMSGLRSGFRSIVGTGGKKKAAADGGQRFWNVLTYILLAGAVAIFLGRYACR